MRIRKEINEYELLVEFRLLRESILKANHLLDSDYRGAVRNTALATVKRVMVSLESVTRLCDLPHLVDGLPARIAFSHYFYHLAAAIEGVNGEFDLRKITGKELGMKRMQPVRKGGLNLAAQSVVDQERA